MGEETGLSGAILHLQSSALFPTAVTWCAANQRRSTPGRSTWVRAKTPNLQLSKLSLSMARVCAARATQAESMLPRMVNLQPFKHLTVKAIQHLTVKASHLTSS